MSHAQIRCANCLRTWKLPCDHLSFVVIDLATRPCPYCEAYTLGCAEGKDATAAPPSRGPAGLRRRVPAQALAQGA